MAVSNSDRKILQHLDFIVININQVNHNLSTLSFLMIFHDFPSFFVILEHFLWFSVILSSDGQSWLWSAILLTAIRDVQMTVTTPWNYHFWGHLIIMPYLGKKPVNGFLRHQKCTSWVKWVYFLMFAFLVEFIFLTTFYSF